MQAGIGRAHTVPRDGGNRVRPARRNVPHGYALSPGEVPGGFSSPGYFAPGPDQTSYRETLVHGQVGRGIEPP